MNDPALIRARFEKSVQAIVDAGACPMEPTTVDRPQRRGAGACVRLGRGDPALLGLEVAKAPERAEARLSARA